MIHHSWVFINLENRAKGDGPGRPFRAMIDTNMQLMSQEGDTNVGGRDKKVATRPGPPLNLPLTDLNPGEGAEYGVHEQHVVGHDPVYGGHPPQEDCRRCYPPPRLLENMMLA